MKNELFLSDKINNDCSISLANKPRPLHRTRVQMYDSTNAGLNELGELLFEEENQIVLGGALFVLEKVFGIESPLRVDYLNNIMGIATTGPTVDEIYSKDNVVCLFGVGTGGAGDAGPVRDVKYQEREIVDIVPFRVTDQPLSVDDQSKYWFRRQLDNGKTAYYLKQFEKMPKIQVLWKDSEGDADGSEVEEGVHDTNRTEPIETFVEMVLKINKYDIKEWFELNGNIEQARVNSLGLFTGVKASTGDGLEDYKQVKLFSKINFHNEMLVAAKDLTIVYRIYTS